ncbi:type III pantothenate kinase [Bradymonadaceae bacterium TMQ3]|uniref:Type III pantothenate kinase n=1 Tax=Lujinxingia sediminis TaxID=2480984 RepID=A0ABY0CNI3_9DELT|nr:type III pantothenate kinase [Lujinxingia sediminis]RDV36345.1 type III pantothenate kinase [Bradymonadaceae bacterium TMQ3]RVU41515.1 type III pantothenate kinase [Lujinxingia sediminis]TXC68433.1 type III pantothenate kinase [Bradymonadales bacterium TMQ1]
MLLVIDVGNTNTVLGVYRGEELVRHWRLQTHHGRTSDEHGIFLRQLFELSGLAVAEVHHAIISCVVPPMERMLVKMVRDYFACNPTVVGADIQANMPIAYDNPREVGADRVVNAVAAYRRHSKALIVVDFGTATTFDAISEEGAYLGGAICPGITISSEALFHAASKLPRVELARSPSVIGKNTVHSIQAGLLYGYIGLVREIVTRMKAELGADNVPVIATGGLASFFAEETDIIDEVDDFLTLEGLRLIFDEASAS